MAGTWRNRYEHEAPELRFESSKGRNNYRTKLSNLVDELNSNYDDWDDEDYWESKERNLME